VSIVYVPLINSPRFAIVDDEDGPRVLQHQWRLRVQNGKQWPVARIDGKDVRLSRFVMRMATLNGVQVITDRNNPLDCRKKSLQTAPIPFSQLAARDKRKARQEKRRKSEEPRCRHLFELAESGRYACLRCKVTARFIFDVDL
jgi:hypothetical protein